MASYITQAPDDFMTIYRCVECGATVHQVGVPDHDLWHEKVRQTIEKVNRLNRIHPMTGDALQRIHPKVP